MKVRGFCCTRAQTKTQYQIVGFIEANKRERFFRASWTSWEQLTKVERWTTKRPSAAVERRTVTQILSKTTPTPKHH